MGGAEMEAKEPRQAGAAAGRERDEGKNAFSVRLASSLALTVLVAYVSSYRVSGFCELSPGKGG